MSEDKLSLKRKRMADLNPEKKFHKLTKAPRISPKILNAVKVADASLYLKSSSSTPDKGRVEVGVAKTGTSSGKRSGPVSESTKIRANDVSRQPDSSDAGAAHRPRDKGDEVNGAGPKEQISGGVDSLKFVHPEEEELRAKHLSRIRQKFERQVDELTGSPAPIMTFERWHLCGLIHPGTKSTEFLIPKTCKEMVRVVEQDLERIEAEPTDISKICDQLKRMADVSRQQLSTYKAANNVQVTKVEHKHSFDLTLGKTLLKIVPSHYQKLVDSWLGPQDESLLLNCIFALLLRYKSLGGHGYQAALNEHAFQILHQRLEVTAECFASPLNRYLPTFCSAFPDTDLPFGSCGSFFSEPMPHAFFDPHKGGSYECNPPFVSEVMVAAARSLEVMSGQCEKRKSPFSAVVIVPGWTDDPMWAALQGSKWRLPTTPILISKDEHGFVDGAQHQRRDRYRESPFDTAIFILQNKAGRLRWPVTAELEVELRAAMHKAIPSDAAKARRLKEGRGFADLDGGGGVYKGKKSKVKNEAGRPDC